MSLSPIAGTDGRSRPVALVVDDEPDMRDVLRTRLGLEGWTVSEAATGEDALEHCRNALPDVVLLDHELPGMSGLECAAALRELSGTTPIIIFSSHLDPKVTEAARRLHVLPMTKDERQRLHDVLDLYVERLRRPSTAGRRAGGR